MKKTIARPIVQWTTSLIIALCTLTMFVLEQSWAQSYLGQKVEEWLQKELQTQVSVGSVAIEGLGQVSLRNLHIADRAGKELMSCGLLFAKMELLPLAEGKISIAKIACLDGSLSVYKSTQESEHNLQFLIDKLRSQPQNDAPSLDLRINSLVLRRMQLRYDAHYAPRAQAGVFHPQHLSLGQVNANISLKHLSADSINLRIRHLSAREHSGLELRHLRLLLLANRHSATISNLLLQLPHSEVSQKSIVLSYPDWQEKDWWKAIATHGRSEHISIASCDLLPLFPALQQMDERFVLKAQYHIRAGQIALSPLQLHNTTGSLRTQTHLFFSYKDSQAQSLRVNQLDLMVKSEMAHNIFRLFNISTPALIDTIAYLHLQGNGEWQFAQKTARYEGEISTALGLVQAKIRYKPASLHTQIESRGLYLRPLHGKNQWPHRASFALQAHLALPLRQQPEGQWQLRLHEMNNAQLRLEKILLTGRLRQGQAHLQVHSEDPKAQLEGEISARVDKNWQLSQLESRLHIKDLRFQEMGISAPFSTARLSGEFQSTLPQLSWKNIAGKIHIRNLSWHKDNAQHYALSQLALTATPHPKGMRLQLRSDCADLDYVGSNNGDQMQQMGQKIWQDVQNLIDGRAENSAPTVPTAPPTHHQAATDTAQRLALRIKRSDFFRQVLGIPLHFAQDLSLTASLDAAQANFQLVAQAPQFWIDKTEWRATSLVLQKHNDSLSLLAKTQKPLKNNQLKAEIQLKNENNALQTRLQWHTTEGTEKNHGTISASTVFRWANESQGTQHHFKTKIAPSLLVHKDSIWSLRGGELSVQNGLINIDRLMLSHKEQYLRIEGAYSRHSEGIRAELNNIDVASMLEAFVDLSVVKFAGKATGQALLHPTAEGDFRVDANLRVAQFRFNHSSMGQLDMVGGFDGKDNRLFFDGTMSEPESRTKVEGYVSLQQKRLDLVVDSKQTNIAFLNYYLGNIFDDIQGRVSGRCRIFGDFKNIDFEGQESGTASLTVPITGVRYHLKQAQVAIRPGKFTLTQGAISDSLGGQGGITAVLQHQHLRNMHYEVKLRGEGMKLYDKPYDREMPFYATAYGSGEVTLSGTPQRLQVDMDIVAQEGSRLTYLIDRPEEVNSQFLQFRSATTPQDSTKTQALVHPAEDNKNNTDIYLNMNIKATPQAVVQLVTDQRSGDLISVRGDGNLQAKYYNKGHFQIFGTYEIGSGSYDLSVQNLIRKRFLFEEGGKVYFSGIPTEADVKIKASYLIPSASLADLNISNTFTNNTIPVNCLLYFTGKMGNMNLKLDFDLLNMGEEEKAMVRNLMATEEERTTQVLYLLGIGRFFTYDAQNTNSALQQVQSTVMMKSLLANTFSAQLNKLISTALGNSNINFGTNISTGQLGWSDMEVDGSLSGHLFNKRLLFNGKVGYHERPSTTNFVGDFNMQYLVTPTGGVSLNAYSQTNERYFTKSTLTTQGVGVQFKRNFSAWKELFRRKKRK